MHISVLPTCMHVHHVHTVPEQVRPREARTSWNESCGWSGAPAKQVESRVSLVTPPHLPR